MTHMECARSYMDGVLGGEISACKFVKQAVQRQVDDLEREGFPYVFDEARAERVCKFVELLPHIKGEWGGKPIKLSDWQAFILTTVFGWVDADGRRRFKTVYTEVPRKNGKSSLSSAIGLYCLTADDEPGAEVYAAGVTRDQAKIVWNDAKRMVERCEGIRDRFGVKAFAHSIAVEETASSFKALSRDQGGNLDGLNTHCAIIDELHAHKTRDIFEVLETSTSSRRSPLVWCISTAGFNRSGICFEQRDYVTRILSGGHDDPEYFGIIYTLDEGDEWTDPQVWKKANPNWGISVKPDDIARKARKAQELASATNNFLTKHLNVWVNADTAWMDMGKWDACSDPTITLDDFEGESCWIGLDLATKTDISALVLLFQRDGKLWAFPRFWLPEDAAEESRNASYPGWVNEGRLTTTPGGATDFSYIEDDIRDYARRFRIKAVGYDSWQSSYLANRLEADGLPMVEIRQNPKQLSEPMKHLEALALSDGIRHPRCPVLTWMVSNVVCHTDANENIYPRKAFPENKIDGVVALLMALNRQLAAEQTGDLDDWLNDPVRI